MQGARFEGKVFVITGSSRGIGQALANYYLDHGAFVCGCSRSAASINHERYRHFCIDLGLEAPVVEMVRLVAREFGGIDVLINNAGLASMNHILTTPYSSMQTIFATNVLGSLLFVREVAKLMSRRYKAILKAGHPACHPPFRIINFATVAVALRLEGEALYAASKAAIINLTEVLAKELGALGITVNAIAPAPLPTDLIKGLPKDKLDALIQRQALKRLANMEDVINVLDFFINPSSDFITGQVLYLGGVSG